MQLHGSKRIVRRAPYLPNPPKGYTGQNSTFSEHGHVAYQINGNHEMQLHGSQCFARRTPTPPPPYPNGQNVKILLFQNNVMLKTN